MIKYTYKFEDEKLQRDFERTCNRLLSYFDDMNITFTKINYVTAISAVRGKYNQVMLEAYNNYQSSVHELSNFIGLKSDRKGYTVGEPSFLKMIAEKIYNKRTGYSFVKLMNELQKLNRSYKKNEELFRIVWYAEYERM